MKYNGANTVLEIHKAPIAEVPRNAAPSRPIKFQSCVTGTQPESCVPGHGCSSAAALSLGLVDFHRMLQARFLSAFILSVPLIAASVLYLGSLTPSYFAFARCSILVLSHSRSLLITVPWFMTFEPLYNLWYRIKGFIRAGSRPRAGAKTSITSQTL